jgi:hypothetical protein
LKKRYKAALLAATFYAGAYTAIASPPTSYTFAGKQILGGPSRALFSSFSSPGELLSAECTVEGRASAAYRDVFEENTKSLEPKGAEVQASAVNIWSHTILPPFLAPWTYLPESRPHEDARNVMLSDDRKTLYWKEGYASLWGETLERKEGMSPYSWMDVISETDEVIVAARAYPGGLFIPQVSSLIIEKKTGRATYSFNDGSIGGNIMASSETWMCD